MVEVKYNNKKKMAYKLNVEEVPTLSQLVYEGKICFEALDKIPTRYSLLVKYQSPISKRNLKKHFKIDPGDLHCFGDEYEKIFMQKATARDLGMGRWFPFDSPDIYRTEIFVDEDNDDKVWIVFAVKPHEWKKE